MAGLWVATANQILARAAVALEIPYPLWFFVLLCLLPFAVMPHLGRWMSRQSSARA